MNRRAANFRGLYEYDNTASAGDFNIPIIEPVDFTPTKMIGFNYARTSKEYDSCIHFFLDDYQFERCWNDPDTNIRILSKFKACLTPDFSLYRDMPRAMMIWNVYRSRLFGQMCQRAGLTVIPTIQYAGPESYDFCFDGLPKHSTVAISTVGVCKDKIAMDLFCQGYAEMLSRLEPTTILFYGKNICENLNPQNIRIVEYQSFSQKQLSLLQKTKK